MVIFCSLPVALSRALTFRMPLASMSKVTSICGTPRGAGRMPSRMNRPSDLLSAAMVRSPCRTWISTLVWLSAAVEKICDLLVGIVVFRGMIGVITPPSVSIPRVSGVTSSSRTSRTSPLRTPAWIAAPMATTSSGFTPLCGSFPKKRRTVSITRGILVWPPTRMTSSTWAAVMPASFKACSHGPSVFSTRSPTSCSSFARVSVKFRCFGPEASAVMNGRLISRCMSVESSIFARSASSFRRWSAMRSCFRSMPCSRLNSSTSQSMMRWSKSSPPRWVSPAVALTWNVPSPISRIEMSKVPPPRS